MIHLLLIEDDPDQALLAQEALQEGLGDLDIQKATTGAEALELDLTAFDVILLDNNLPDMTGLEVLRHCASRPHAPIIMVTGDEVLEFAVEALKEGAEDYVIKSLELHQMLPAIVQRTLENHRQRQTLTELENREREKRIQIETLKRIMMTLAHHLNNAIMPITFSAELCERSEYSLEAAHRLVETCLKETQRITAIIERFEQYVEYEEFRYADYLDLKNAMFDVNPSLVEDPL